MQQSKVGVMALAGCHRVPLWHPAQLTASYKLLDIGVLSLELCFIRLILGSFHDKSVSTRSGTDGLEQDSRNSSHYSDIIMGAMASEISSFTIVYSTVYSGANQRKHQSSASLAICVGNSPVNSPHKWPVTRKMLPFDDVIMVNTLELLPSSTKLSVCKQQRNDTIKSLI